MTRNEMLKSVLEELRSICFQNTSMLLDIACEQLEHKYGLNATFYGRSIYIDNERVCSVEVSVEAKDCVGLYKYYLLKEGCQKWEF